MDVTVTNLCWVKENGAVLKRIGNKEEMFVKRRVPIIRLACWKWLSLWLPASLISGILRSFKLVSWEGLFGRVEGIHSQSSWIRTGKYGPSKACWLVPWKPIFQKQVVLCYWKTNTQPVKKKTNCCKMFYVDTVNVAEMWKCRLTVRQG